MCKSCIHKDFQTLSIITITFFVSSTIYLSADNIKRRNTPYNKDIKGAGSRGREQSCYLYNLYFCPHVAIVFGTYFSGWGESITKLLITIHHYPCHRVKFEYFARFACVTTKFKNPSSKQHLHFERSSGKSL